MVSAWQLSIDDRGVAHLGFDLPEEKVNKLSNAVLEEFSQILDQLASNDQVKLLVLTSGKEGVFIAGADLNSFKVAFRDAQVAKAIIELGHRVLNQLDNLPFPTLAVINGACLGGGMELALACDFRLVTDHPKTMLGLPEVTLGIFPGWGGTQRLPRLIGLQEALGLILTGKTIDGLKAFKIHLADGIAPWEFLDQYTKTFSERCLSATEREKMIARREHRTFSQHLLEGNPIGRLLIAHQARKGVLEKSKGHYPAPLVALDLIMQSYTLPLAVGLDKERKVFNESMVSSFSNAKYLLGVHFGLEHLKKNAGYETRAAPHEVHRAALCGAGVMGGGIAWLFANRDISIRMKDIQWEAIGKALAEVSRIFYLHVNKLRKIKPYAANLKFHQVSGTLDYSGFSHADFVIEAVIENLDIKRKVYQELEEVVSPDTVIATNTSSLTIAELSQEIAHPERFVGMHFFNPADRMPLVEVVKGEKTSDQTLATTIALCRKLGKIPLVVQDCPGFLVNRIFAMASNEVMWLLHEGATISELENLLISFGMPMGPFTLADEVGIDVTAKVMKTLERAYGERMKVPPILEAMYQNQYFGRKTNKGFFLYSHGEKGKLNPQVRKLLKEAKLPHQTLAKQEQLDRILFAMIGEAARCLEAGIVKDPTSLDMAMILGTGFPPFRGGLLAYADTHGLANIVTGMETLQQTHGPRFEPCPLLKQLALAHQTFYKNV